jgi:hypothetical protein
MSSPLVLLFYQAATYDSTCEKFTGEFQRVKLLVLATEFFSLKWFIELSPIVNFNSHDYKWYIQD